MSDEQVTQQFNNPIQPPTNEVKSFSNDTVEAFAANGLLTTKAQIAGETGFMYYAGQLWHHIKAYGSTTLTGYEDVLPQSGCRWITPASGVTYNAMTKITRIRNLVAENSAYNVDSDATNQPYHFDNANTFAAALRSLETGFTTSLKNSVTTVMTKYDAFIKAQAPKVTGFSGTTTKEYISTVMDDSDWTTQTASYNGADFIDFWRFAMKSELRIPMYKYTHNGSAWAQTTINGALTYGASVEARYTASGTGGTPVTISGYQTYDTAWNTGVTTSATLTGTYAAGNTPTATTYTVLGTKTNVKNVRLGWSGTTPPYGLYGGTSGSVITVYSR